MCLTTVDENPKRKFGIGYKVAHEKDGILYSWDYLAGAGRTVYPIGDWLTDNKKGEITIDWGASAGLQYPVGFHIGLELNRAISLVQLFDCPERHISVFKCRFKNVRATGAQNSYGKVAVARKIKILEEVK